MTLPRLHLITDSGLLQSPDFPAVAAAVLDCCGVDLAVHVRGHGMPGRQLHEIAERLAAAALRTGAWLFVNDRVDVAMAVRANGIQVGRRSLRVADVRMLIGAGARIGVSAHDRAETVQADIDGADFVVLGTIYPSPSHADGGSAGPRHVADAAAATSLPLLAIGGLTVGRIPEIAAAGAYGVAVLSGVWHAPDPALAAEGYVNALRAAWSDEDDDGTD